jgi:hypothetical protein
MADAAKPTGGEVKAVVLATSYAWHETCNDPSTPRHEAAHGDEITVSGAEWDRSQTMVPKALGKASDAKKAADDAADADPPADPAK